MRLKMSLLFGLIIILGLSIKVLASFSTRALTFSNLGGASEYGEFRSHQCLGQNIVGDFSGDPRSVYTGIMNYNGFYQWLLPVLEYPEDMLPKEFKLHQNFPNPFNPGTTINYDIAKPCQVNLKIYNILGKEVASLVDEMKEPGYYSTSWSSETVASGIYFYRIETKDFVQVKKLMIIK